LFFDNDTKAYEGKRALIQLDSEGSISVYGYAVVAKNTYGTAARIITHGIFSPTPRTKQIRGSSSGMAGLGLPIQTTGPFRR
jgi:hypothetical protein